MGGKKMSLEKFFQQFSNIEFMKEENYCINDKGKIIGWNNQLMGFVSPVFARYEEPEPKRGSRTLERFLV